MKSIKHSSIMYIWLTALLNLLHRCDRACEYIYYYNYQYVVEEVYFYVHMTCNENWQFQIFI